MSEFLLEVEERSQFGKNANRRLRTAGKIPAVVYGPKFDSVGVAISPKDLIAVLQSESGRNTIFGVNLAGKKTDVMIRDYQLDPIKGTLVHVDLLAVSLDQVMEFQVPVEVTGTPVGVKTEGGILEHVLREIDVSCLPGDVPDNISVDVTELDINDSIRVSDLQVDSKITILSDSDLVLVMVTAPKVLAEDLEEEVEETAEPELIRKGREESEDDEE